MNMDHLDVSFNVFGSNFTVNGAGVLGLDPMYIYIYNSQDHQPHSAAAAASLRGAPAEDRGKRLVIFYK